MRLFLEVRRIPDEIVIEVRIIVIRLFIEVRMIPDEIVY